MEELTGGDIVVAALEQAGVDVVFGIPSVHNLPIYDAIRRRGTIRAITVRHEQGASGAADGYARVTGRLGVFITSTGPGAANAMGGLLEAYVSSSPVLHLTGQIDSRYLDLGRGFIHEVPDQPAMLGSLSKWHGRVASVETIAAKVSEAVLIALGARQGPVSLEIPIDLQYELCDPAAAGLGGAAPEVARMEPDAAQVELAAAELAAAGRPLIWAGGGVVAAGAAPELAAVARLLGAGVITSPNGRGVLPEDDALCLGNLSWDAGVRELCQEADVLLAVGTRFQGPNTENWKMELPSKIVHVDVDPLVPDRSYPAKCVVIGDAKLALVQIAEALEARGRAPGGAADWVAKVGRTAAGARARLRQTLGAQEALLDATEEVLPPWTVVVKDATVPAYTWGNRLLRVSGVRQSVMPNGFAIGLGLPHAVGAATAADSSRPVVLIAGDGGFMLAATELATVAAERLPLVVLVFNDGGYGILRNIQDKQYGGRIGVELGRPDFCGLAESLGVGAQRVDSVPSYRQALAKALELAAAGEPRLIEIDLDAIGPMASPYIGTSRPPNPA